MSARAVLIESTGNAARAISAALLSSSVSMANYWSKPSEQPCGFEQPNATGPVISV